MIHHARPDRYHPAHRDPALQTPGVLPVPILSVRLTHTPNSHDFARIDPLDRAERPRLRREPQLQADDEEGRRADRKRSACSVCGGPHNRRNPLCPGRPAAAPTPAPAARPELRGPTTTRSRCATRYARLCCCSLGEAADAFGISDTAARNGWIAMYPGVPTDPAQRGDA